MDYKGMKKSKTKFILFILAATLAAFISGCATTGTGTPASMQTPLKPSLNQITDISVSDAPESSSVFIKSTAKLAYTSVKQPFPLGVTLYFPDTTINNIASNIPSDTDTISSIETYGMAENEKASKINILLKRDVPYEVAESGSGLNVVFKKTAISSNENPAEAKEGNTRIETANLMAAGDIQKSQNESKTILPSKKEATSPSGIGKPAWVNRIDFSSEEAGKSTLIVGTSRPIQYNVEKKTPMQLILNLYNTNIPDYRQRQLITTKFESALDRIIPAQTLKMKNNSVISIELRESVPYFVEQNENLIMIHFEASSVPPRNVEQAGLPSWDKMVAESVLETEKPAEIIEETQVPKEEEGTVQATDKYFEKKEYTGEKIALDFYETDIKNVFRILREISGKNFVIDDDVTGKVTMTIDKPVPWDQILDLVLKMNQLGLVYEGDIIRIANLKTIEKESASLMESITAEREAKDKIKDLAPLLTEYIPVSYSNAKAEVFAHLQSIITKDRGSISVDERNNQIIITDTAEKINRAKEIVKNIDKVTPQVIIEAKIVEMSSKTAKEIGVEWGMEGGIQSNDPRAGIGPQRGFNALGGTYGWTTAMNFPATSGSGIGFNFTRIAGTPFVLDARLTALASSDDIRIISAPKVVTLDNKKAMIKQGLEIGYYDQPAAAPGTVSTGEVSVEWKEVVLKLEVTPHVTPDGRISMKIAITKDDVSGYFNNIPEIAKNEASTELLVNDADTIVIGGIMKTNHSLAETRFPGLSKIPGIGRLFRNELNTNTNNELLIFISPRIVQLEQKAM